ncbi:hypothetical protein GCM10011317_12260 [Niveispirillum cyanobacteriorum]|nr:hypothetical protein GCM10011317_12260 [Niveispirillum cyanobacteriorum]
MASFIDDALSPITAPRPIITGTAMEKVIFRLMDQLPKRAPNPPAEPAAGADLPVGRMVRLIVLISLNLSCPFPHAYPDYCTGTQIPHKRKHPD